MSQSRESWPTVAVVGAGAVGCYFGGMLARAGAPVTLIGRPQHVDAMNRDGLFLDGLRVKERITVRAATDISAVRGAQLVLMCVKTLDTETVAQSLHGELDEDAVVLSLQNGVDNVARIYSSTGMVAVPTVVYVAAAMAGPGHIKHSGRGDLLIGHLPMESLRSAGEAGARSTSSSEPDLAAIVEMFERADVPCRISPDVRVELWTKMVLNCAYNAISALGRANYGAMAASAGVRELMNRAIEEAVAVARGEGVALSADDMITAASHLGDAMPAATSSTSQDIARGKLTEIDSLNGYVVRRGAALGIETPISSTLHTLVKLLESPR